METNNQNKENGNLNRLVSKLKTQDNKYANISKAFQTIYWIFIPLYAVLTGIEYIETHRTGILVGGGSFILSFLIFALFFRKYYKEYKYVDYSLPTVQMLKKAVWRYQPFHKRTIWIFSAIIFMDIGLTQGWLENDVSILSIQIIYFGLMAIAVIIGLIIWRIKYKPLRDEALRLLKEIEEN